MGKTLTFGSEGGALGHVCVCLKDILPKLFAAESGTIDEWWSLGACAECESGKGEIRVSITLPEPSLYQFAADHFPKMLYDSPKVLETGPASVEEKFREESVNEFLKFEEEYVSVLATLVHTFRDPLLNRHILSSSEAASIFLNAEEILDLHQTLLGKLRKSHADFSSVTKLILEHANQMKLYALFCNLSTTALEQVQKLILDRPDFAAFLKEDKPAWRGKSLFSYLLKPIQNVGCYPGLVQVILNRTPAGVEGHQELKSAYKVLLRLSERTRKDMHDQNVQNASREAWKMIEAAPSCDKYLKANLPLLASLSQFPGSSIPPSVERPRVLYHHKVSYQRDQGVSVPGTLIVFENGLLLVSHTKGSS